MSTLHIWGRMSSINVRKVVLAAQWMGLNFKRTDAGLSYGINKTPAYLRMNPNAQVPVMQDGDFTLWESNVIVRYLCAKHGAPTRPTASGSLSSEGAVPRIGRLGAAAFSAHLYPENLTKRFDAERWMDWQQTTMNNAGREDSHTRQAARYGGHRPVHRGHRALAGHVGGAFGTAPFYGGRTHYHGRFSDSLRAAPLVGLAAAASRSTAQRLPALVALVRGYLRTERE
jgi:glutathione S-transferase